MTPELSSGTRKETSPTSTVDQCVSLSIYGMLLFLFQAVPYTAIIIMLYNNPTFIASAIAIAIVGILFTTLLFVYVLTLPS